MSGSKFSRPTTHATQLADTMDSFTLKEALHLATMPFEHVHRAESRRLEREEEADKIWA
jgi:hypothetical protein